MKVTVEESVPHLIPLLENLQFALQRIAPERAMDLEQVAADVEVIVRTEPGWRVETIFGCVRLSTTVIEVVWALSYSYWTLYEQVAGKSAATGAIAVPATPELDEALRLFSWAISRAQGGSASWPVNTPSPTTASVRAIVATELTLGAVAVYLIHELHHINVSKPMTEASSTSAAPADAMKEEYDADAYAASTVLRSAPEEGRVKRTLALAVGLLVIAGHWLSAERDHPSDHPPGVERLIRALRAHLAPDDAAWAVVAAMLSLHVRVATPAATLSGSYDSFRDAVIAYGDALSTVRD